MPNQTKQTIEMVRVNTRISKKMNDWLEKQSAETGVPKSTLIYLSVRDLCSTKRSYGRYDGLIRETRAIRKQTVKCCQWRGSTQSERSGSFILGGSLWYSVPKGKGEVFSPFKNAGFKGSRAPVSRTLGVVPRNVAFTLSLLT